MRNISLMASLLMEIAKNVTFDIFLDFLLNLVKISQPIR